MKLKAVRNTIKAATIAATNLVLTNKTTRLVSDATGNMLRMVLDGQQIKAAVTGNILKAAALLGKFFEFKELDDTASASESIDFDIDKVINITGRASEQHNLNITRPLADSIPRPTDLASLNPIKQPSDTSTATDSDPIFDVTKGPRDIPIASELFTVDLSKVLSDSVSATDDVNGTAVGDESNLTVFKLLTENSPVAETHVLSVTKDLSDTASTSESGLVFAQNYVDNPQYFASDYVGQSQSF